MLPGDLLPALSPIDAPLEDDRTAAELNVLRRPAQLEHVALPAALRQWLEPFELGRLRVDAKEGDGRIASTGSQESPAVLVDHRGSQAVNPVG